MFDGNGNWTSEFSAESDRDNGIKILVFNLNDPDNIVRAARGEGSGTLVE